MSEIEDQVDVLTSTTFTDTRWMHDIQQRRWDTRMPIGRIRISFIHVGNYLNLGLDWGQLEWTKDALESQENMSIFQAWEKLDAEHYIQPYFPEQKYRLPSTTKRTLQTPNWEIMVPPPRRNPTKEIHFSQSLHAPSFPTTGRTRNIRGRILFANLTENKIFSTMKTVTTFLSLTLFEIEKY